MAKEYIERETAIKKYCEVCNSICGIPTGAYCRQAKAFNLIPAADVVEREVVAQIQWERDTAVAQLAEIGKSLGEKMDDVVPYEIYLHDVLSRDMALQQIGASSESTQPHGEWLYEPITCGDYVLDIKRVCSRCHWSEKAVERTIPIAAPVRNYCPNCGASMRKGGDV